MPVWVARTHVNGGLQVCMFTNGTIIDNNSGGANNDNGDRSNNNDGRHTTTNSSSNHNRNRDRHFRCPPLLECKLRVRRAVVTPHACKPAAVHAL